MDPQKLMLGTAKLLYSWSLYAGGEAGSSSHRGGPESDLRRARDRTPLQGVRIDPTPEAFVQQQNMVRLDFYPNCSGGGIERGWRGWLQMEAWSPPPPVLSPF